MIGYDVILAFLGSIVLGIVTLTLHSRFNHVSADESQTLTNQTAIGNVGEQLASSQIRQMYCILFKIYVLRCNKNGMKLV